MFCIRKNNLSCNEIKGVCYIHSDKVIAKRGLRILVVFTCITFLVQYALAQNPKQLTHKKDFYHDSQGALYAPESLPFFLYISHSANSTGLEILKSNSEMVYLKEGKNTICIPTTFTNNDSIKVVKTCYDVISDGTAPKTILDFSDAEKFVVRDTNFFGRNLNVHITGSDNLSGLQKIFVSVNAENFKPLNEIQWSFVDGKYSIYYYGIDNVGNVEVPKSHVFISDITAPVTRSAITGNTSAEVLASGTKVTFLSSDNLSGLKAIFYQIDSSSKIEYKVPITITGIKNGEHTISWFGVDNVNNVEQLKTSKFYYDTIPPIVEMSIAGNKTQKGNTIFVSSKPSISISGTDNRAGLDKIEYAIESSDYGLYGQPFSLPDKSGLYRVRYSATDKVKNISDVAMQKIYLDLTAPETYCKYSQSSYLDKDTIVLIKGTVLDLIATDLESGVNKSFYSINSSSDSTYKKPITFGEPGLYCLNYYTVDNVLNSEKKKSQWIRVNNSIQKLETRDKIQYSYDWIKANKTGLTGAKDGGFYLRISESPDDTASYLIFVEDENVKQNSVIQPLKFTTHGKNTLQVKAANKKLKIPITIDGKAPTVNAIFDGAVKFTQNRNTFFGEGLKVSINAKDNPDESRSGLMSLYYSINKQNFGLYNQPLNLFNIEQEYILNYYALDSVRNMTDIKEERFTVDVSPPYTSPEFEKGVLGNIISPRSIIRLKCSDNLSGIKNVYYWFDSDKEKVYNQAINPNDISSLSEGEHKFNYYAIDNVNNKETVHSANLLIDLTSPDVQLVLSGSKFNKENYSFITSQTKITLKAVETTTEIKSFTYQINGGAAVDYTTTISVPKQFGPMGFSYTCSDQVDNVNTKTQSFFIDDIAPTTAVSFSGPQYNEYDNKYINYQTKILIHSEDQGSGINRILYSLGAEAMKAYTSPIQIQGTGNYQITYFAIDNLNNREESQQVSFFVDNTFPTLKIMFSADGPEVLPDKVNTISPYTFIHIATDDNVGLEGVFYSINEEEQQVYRKPISNFEHGKTITFKAYAIDRVGNKTEKSIKFIVE